MSDPVPARAIRPRAHHRGRSRLGSWWPPSFARAGRHCAAQTRPLCSASLPAPSCPSRVQESAGTDAERARPAGRPPTLRPLHRAEALACVKASLAPLGACAALTRASRFRRNRLLSERRRKPLRSALAKRRLCQRVGTRRVLVAARCQAISRQQQGHSAPGRTWRTRTHQSARSPSKGQPRDAALATARRQAEGRPAGNPATAVMLTGFAVLQMFHIRNIMPEQTGVQSAANGDRCSPARDWLTCSAAFPVLILNSP